MPDRLLNSCRLRPYFNTKHPFCESNTHATPKNKIFRDAVENVHRQSQVFLLNNVIQRLSDGPSCWFPAPLLADAHPVKPHH